MDLNLSRNKTGHNEILCNFDVARRIFALLGDWDCDYNTLQITKTFPFFPSGFPSLCLLGRPVKSVTIRYRQRMRFCLHLVSGYYLLTSQKSRKKNVYAHPHELVFSLQRKKNLLEEWTFLPGHGVQILCDHSDTSVWPTLFVQWNTRMSVQVTVVAVLSCLRRIRQSSRTSLTRLSHQSLTLLSMLLRSCVSSQTSRFVETCKNECSVQHGILSDV